MKSLHRRMSDAQRAVVEHLYVRLTPETPAAHTFYDPTARALYVYTADTAPIARTVSAGPGVLVDLMDNGRPYGIEVLDLDPLDDDDRNEMAEELRAALHYGVDLEAIVSDWRSTAYMWKHHPEIMGALVEQSEPPPERFVLPDGYLLARAVDCDDYDCPHGRDRHGACWEILEDGIVTMRDEGP